MPELTLDYNAQGHEPVYLRIKSRLREDIISGRLQSLSKLPPVRALANSAGVSLGTMSRVVNELVDEGLCFRRSRLGIYVNRKSAFTGQKTIIHLRSGFHSDSDDYVQRTLALDDNRLYPNCSIRSIYVSPDQIHSPALNYELEKIKAEHPNCLLVDTAVLTREEVSKVMAMPFPILFVGDFSFGEMRDPDLNLIRGDSTETGFELVKAAYTTNCRTAAFFGGSSDSYWSRLIHDGADRAAREFGIKLRYYNLADRDYHLKTEVELYQMKRSRLEAMLSDGLPDIVIFNGHTELDIIVRILAELGVAVGRDVKLISNRELVSGGIFLQPDYTQFRHEAAEIINQMIGRCDFHPGSRTLSGTIKYRLISINNI